MKLSTNSEYGLRALADLAAHLEGKTVPVASIAKRQNISGKYLELMFSSMKRAGLVRSVKGTGGGYLLSRSAADIRLGDVLGVLEGDLSIVDDDVSREDEPSLRRCIKQNVWDVVSGRISGVFDSMSLQDLLDNKVNLI
jgi:Rrf2 family cysteine metabolism transcriptional repressor